MPNRCLPNPSPQSDEALSALDWDDIAGQTARRLAGLAHEKARQAEMRRKRVEGRGLNEAKVKVCPLTARTYMLGLVHTFV